MCVCYVLAESLIISSRVSSSSSIEPLSLVANMALLIYVWQHTLITRLARLDMSHCSCFSYETGALSETDAAVVDQGCLNTKSGPRNQASLVGTQSNSIV